MDKLNEISRDELTTFDLPQNYSMILHKFEQMALEKLANLSVNQNNEIFTSESSEEVHLPVPAGRAPPPSHGITELEYAKVVDDIVIGAILAMLVISVVFFICSCFIYHKFQEWKNSYRSSHVETGDVFRYDVDVESLPSYTIVSGLPTYDDALEEFRKSGIILSTPITVIKIFENETKQKPALSDCDSSDTNTASTTDTISVGSICTCATPSCASNSVAESSILPANATANPLSVSSNRRPTTRASQIIELSPHQLQVLSRKRLSLQIAFNGSIRHNSRRVDLYREANRNNHLRSNLQLRPTPAVNVVMSDCNAPASGTLPGIHRSTSTMSLANDHNANEHAHCRPHRGSLT